MNDKGLTVEEILNILNNAPKTMECFKVLGTLTPEKKAVYEEKYKYFIFTNENENLNGKNRDEDNRIKGKALEDLVSVMFEATGEYFEIYRNIRNGSNEVDIFIEFSGKGKKVSSLLDDKYSNIICECKNYGKHVGVTYVGKFYSLMQCTNNSVGIMFSYGGFSGRSWGAATGLTKKLFLLREKEVDKTYILDFNKRDFEAILKGESLFEILDNKCRSLRMGVDDITKYIVKHPNEDRTIEEE